jgi:hypothetical protein
MINPTLARSQGRKQQKKGKKKDPRASTTSWSQRPSSPDSETPPVEKLRCLKLRAGLGDFRVWRTGERVSSMSLAQSLSSLSVDWEVRCQSMAKIRELCESADSTTLYETLLPLAKQMAIQASLFPVVLALRFFQKNSVLARLYRPGFRVRGRKGCGRVAVASDFEC